MAVVKLKSTVFGTTGANGYMAPNASSRDGNVHVVAGRVTAAAIHKASSQYVLAEIPWGAILLPSTVFLTKDWAFAQAVIGVPEHDHYILNAAKGTATGGQFPVTFFGPLWNKPFWQICGLPGMPVEKGFGDLTVFARTDATSAGTLDFQIEYTLHI